MVETTRVPRESATVLIEGRLSTPRPNCGTVFVLPFTGSQVRVPLLACPAVAPAQATWIRPPEWLQWKGLSPEE
jgi:hypothetical protein